MKISIENNELIVDDKTAARIARLPDWAQALAYAMLTVAIYSLAVLSIAFGLVAMMFGVLMIPLSLAFMLFMIPFMLIGYFIQELINLVISPLTDRRLTYIKINT